MQTFLPDPDFATAARLLDARRLGRQRVETLQVLRDVPDDLPYVWPVRSEAARRRNP